MLGYGEDELPNTVETWKALLLPEDVPRGYAAVEAHWERGEPYEIVLRYRRKDGSIAHMLARGKAAQNAAGEWVRMAGTHTDITALVEAQEEIARLNEALEVRVRSRTEELEAFAHSVSHDLRAPLRAMDGYSVILMEDHSKSLDPEAAHAVARIRHGVFRMSAIIDALLALSRVSRADLRREQVDLSAMAQQIFAERRETDPELRAQAEIAPGIVLICDKQLIRLALENLLANALKFSAGAQQPKVHVELDSRGVLRVRDNGIGFDMRHADRLFEPFARLHAGGHTGTGIGLAIVRRAVERHGGRVWADGEEGVGASFFVSLDPEAPEGESEDAP